MAVVRRLAGKLSDVLDVRRPRSAATKSLLFVLLVVLVALTLQVLGWATATTDRFAKTPEFRTWAGFGGMTAAIWAVAFIAGHVHVSDVATLAPAGESRKHPYRNYGWQAIALAVLVLRLLLLLGGGGGFEVSLGAWGVLRVAIPTLGIVAAVPWIITIWWTHDDLSQVRKDVSSALLSESENRRWATQSLDHSIPWTTLGPGDTKHPRATPAPRPMAFPSTRTSCTDSWGHGPASSRARGPWQPS